MVSDSQVYRVGSNRYHAFDNSPNIFYGTFDFLGYTSSFAKSGSVVGSSYPLSSGVGTVLRITVNLEAGSVEFYDESMGRVVMKVQDSNELKSGKWWLALEIANSGTTWELQ